MERRNGKGNVFARAMWIYDAYDGCHNATRLQWRIYSSGYDKTITFIMNATMTQLQLRYRVGKATMIYTFTNTTDRWLFSKFTKATSHDQTHNSDQ